MPARNIVIGQRVNRVKAQRAKELRRQMTAGEKLLWERLRANRLLGLHFRRQQVIGGFIVDFYCHAAALVIEVDGGIHQRQIAYDEERDRVLSARGLRVLRFSDGAIRKDLPNVLAIIAAACRESP